MNETLVSLNVLRSFGVSPWITQNYQIKAINLNVAFSLRCFVFGAIDHFIGISSFSHFLSRVSVLSGKTEVGSDAVYKWVTFDNIESSGNGGCILCDVNIKLEIDHCMFQDIKCEGEGGALYIRKASILIKHSCFELCRTVYKNVNQVGGNAMYIGESTVMLDNLNIFQCWIDSQCGDSICLIHDGDIKVKHKNSSQCDDNRWGEDICYEYGTKTCLDSFVNTFNCSLNWVQSTTYGVGIRISSYMNIVKISLKDGFLHQEGSSYTLEHSCFFGISNYRLKGKPIFSDCICNFSLSDVTYVALESTHKINGRGVCLRTYKFSDNKEEVKLTLLSFLYVLTM